jgi:hypothetical protein
MPEAAIDFEFLVNLSESATIQKVNKALMVLWGRRHDKVDPEGADQFVIISGWASWRNSA